MTAQTVVVGAGVSGLSVALALLQRSHKVTVLERGEAGSESSWAGGGILAPLLPWDYPAAASALALHSMTMYAEWVGTVEAASGRNAEFWRCGMMALDVAEPDEALAWCAAHGMKATRGSAASVKGLDDASDSRAVWLPEVAQVRNPRLVAALKGAVTASGGVIREQCAVTAIDAEAGHATAVRTSEGDFAAETLVVTTGAWAGLGLPGLPPAPHVRPIRGQMLLFRLAPGMLTTILYRDGLYLIPRRDGHILVGSTVEDVGFNKETDVKTGQRLHREAAELLPALRHADPVQHWSGLRPGSPENIPLVGRHPDFDNVYLNVGHYRYGVTMAPASAELLADLMEGRAPTLDPEPYSWASALGRSWGNAD